ncbi:MULTISPECIES: VWA domain-containing protein [Corynebacterium]|uniref:VWA domain-containing protein n=1 Tax=Corynebacterium TaxID=1716 RepID=UPI000668C7A1|nr:MULTISPECIES: VWA domain-containing protein [Corynebacterium]KAA9243559.1 VWA domain-containing protein [Corynebacterium amycolatum]MBC6768989.1 VWA domain-containing protein [Corynebacterium sp. LK15]MCG7268741.1 VWA domain-containing protein [Corynebacterium amycolatum]MDK6476869.1 VWA domain-containing protein [Corynebacterium amycolatum]MDK8505805.1 VWA domain-containing protein [Corynebacterium amycolatum]
MNMYKALTALRKMLLGLVGVLGIFAVAACSDGGLNLPLGSDEEKTNKVDVDSDLKGSTMRIAGATELAELQPLMQKASDDLGFTINLELVDGTVKNSHALVADEFDNQFDATWFATNRYVDLLGGADKLGEAKKVATSPVAFGIHSAKARELGWDTKQPTWAEIAEAASSGKLTYGMTNPAESNSGFSGVVSVATAFADTGSALTTGDINRTTPELQKFFEGQKMTSGSSGWLRDKFLDESDSVDALINYEAVLQQMNKEGADLEVVVPSDGVISADYPLTPLAQPANDLAARQTEALGQWLEANSQVLADHFLRPVSDDANLPESMTNSVIIELPFPGDRAVTDRLIEAYDNDLRVPGESVFVLDTSGSMFGERIADLQATMRAIVDGSARTETGSVGLRNREIATILPFSTSVGEPTTTTIDGPESRAQLTAAVDGLYAEGETALYDALIQAFDLLGSSDKNSIPSIVVLTDGQVTSGKSFAEFRDFYQSKGGNLPPVFVIRYGEADPGEMQELANLTGGKVFESRETELADVFKEIRGYQ